jgi:hypothetical protein
MPCIVNRSERQMDRIVASAPKVVGSRGGFAAQCLIFGLQNGYLGLGRLETHLQACDMLSSLLTMASLVLANAK